MKQKKYMSSFVSVVAIVFFVGSIALLGAASAHAQTFSSNQPVLYIPAGYQPYGYSTYYSSATRLYYDPPTGQYSTLAPLGPAPFVNGGYVNIPAGYTSSNFGTYYNASAGYYYDPSTGFYSTSAPTGQIYAVSQSAYPSYNYPVYSPGLPNTGAGGNTPVALAVLVLTALVSLGGIAYLSRKTEIAVS